MIFADQLKSDNSLIVYSRYTNTNMVQVCASYLHANKRQGWAATDRFYSLVWGTLLFWSRNISYFNKKYFLKSTFTVFCCDLLPSYFCLFHAFMLLQHFVCNVLFSDIVQRESSPQQILWASKSSLYQSSWSWVCNSLRKQQDPIPIKQPLFSMSS